MSEIDKIKQRMLEKMMNRKVEMPNKPLKATDENFDEIISKYKLVVVDFWAPWCGPCRMVAPVIEKLAKEMKGEVVFAKLNTDENNKIAMRFRIMSIPTLIIFRDGKMVDKLIGALPADMLRDWIERHI
ncbi:MAG TPA: thioredoxin [Thermoplasmata archaeon]|nr:thioredoxin [Thermoplasmata archaeon]